MDQTTLGQAVCGFGEPGRSVILALFSVTIAFSEKVKR